MRKVIELNPALHAAVIDAAHLQRCKVKDLGIVLVAYALEHLDDALHNADRLYTHWEQAEAPEATFRVIKTVQRRA